MKNKGFLIKGLGNSKVLKMRSNVVEGQSFSAIDLIVTLEPEVAKRLISNYNRERESLDYMYSRPCDVIMNLYWGGTPEGNDYWDGVYTGLRDGIIDTSYIRCDNKGNPLTPTLTVKDIKKTLGKGVRVFVECDSSVDFNLIINQLRENYSIKEQDTVNIISNYKRRRVKEVFKVLPLFEYGSSNYVVYSIKR